MGAKEWDDIKRVRDEAERILRAPYDVSLKASSILPYRIKPHLPTNVLQSPKADGNDTFQKFRDILGQISRESLQLWSSGNLCQIYGLAAIVVDSLEQSLLSIELLQVLCVLHSNIVHLPSNQTNEWVCEACIPSFCDAALKRQPVLLHTLMTKATSSESLFGKVCRLPFGMKWAKWITVCKNLHFSPISKFTAAGPCYPAKTLDNTASQSSSNSYDR